jgi:UDP-glucose 4-epimerase
MAVNLVTGGAGFLGCHVVRAGLEERALAGDEWVVLDDLSGGFRDNVPEHPRVRFVHGDIGDASLVEDLFREHRFTRVYHLAAYAAEGLSHFIRRFNYTNNVVGSATLINAAVRHGTRHFVFTSSIAVYGSAQVPMTEETVPQPEDPYGIAKYAVELDLRAAGELWGLNWTVFRPHNVYGEYQNINDRYRNVVGIFMKSLLEGRPMPIFGDGEQQRAFTYVGDVAPILVQAPLIPEARNRVFNIGSDRTCTVNQLARTVAELMDRPLAIERLPARHEVAVAWSDHTRCREVFGATEDTPLDEGLRRMAGWVRTSEFRGTTRNPTVEVDQHLPASWT